MRSENTLSDKRLKFPYGNANFYTIRDENYYYVDRTDRIPLIEETGRFLLFLRPRRFGKSLLLSMLENYYDIRMASEFKRLFGDLSIAKSPTDKHNRYLVLKWNFSKVRSQGDLKDITKALYNHLNDGLRDFESRYRELLTYKIEIDHSDAISSLASTVRSVRATPYRIYLLIDEYDNFANEVLMAERDDRKDRYESLIKGEGVLKTFFKAIKAETEGGGIDRIFITGVSPVVMSDITSGFSIATNIYLEPEFNDLCGFTESEVSETLDLITRNNPQICEMQAEALDMMREFYNGYRFSYDKVENVYNPTLSLYFFGHLKIRSRYPRQFLDTNLAMDRGKITYISNLPYGNAVISDALNEKKPLSINELSDRFGIEDILSGIHDRTFMISLLYYFGVLTLSEERTHLGGLNFKIPNLVIRRLYAERIQELLLPDYPIRVKVTELLDQFYEKGDISKFCSFIEENLFPIFDNRDYRWTNELTIKTLFLSLLFNDTFYIMDSEPTIKRSYADLLMIVRPDMRIFKLLDILIEFKYISLEKIGLSGEQVRSMKKDELSTLGIVKEVMAEGLDKVGRYRGDLLAIYQGKLILKTFVVVSIGYERLIHSEVVGET